MLEGVATTPKGNGWSVVKLDRRPKGKIYYFNGMIEGLSVFARINNLPTGTYLYAKLSLKFETFVVCTRNGSVCVEHAPDKRLLIGRIRTMFRQSMARGVPSEKIIDALLRDASFEALWTPGQTDDEKRAYIAKISAPRLIPSSAVK